jgi:hypothetical protein
MILNNIPVYDGKLLHSRFAYTIFRKDVLAVGNIIAFVAPAEVTDNLVDLEDALEKDYIFSESMCHFCWELPNVDIFGAIAFQRLFNTLISEILTDIIKHPIKMKGDDLMVIADHNGGGIHQTTGKASVSITCLRNGAAVGHTGINIDAGKRAPAFAYSTNMSPAQQHIFMTKVIETFYETVDSIFTASTKTI